MKGDGQGDDTMGDDDEKGKGTDDQVGYDELDAASLAARRRNAAPLHGACEVAAALGRPTGRTQMKKKQICIFNSARWRARATTR